jgi:hypothetical protein
LVPRRALGTKRSNTIYRRIQDFSVRRLTDCFRVVGFVSYSLSCCCRYQPTRRLRGKRQDLADYPPPIPAPADEKQSHPDGLFSLRSHSIARASLGVVNQLSFARSQFSSSILDLQKPMKQSMKSYSYIENSVDGGAESAAMERMAQTGDLPVPRCDHDKGKIIKIKGSQE